ncbi:MAG: hypothetical protein ACK4S6_14150 [Roseateles asaccharophilus]|uniref:hypothetical protein n=1 Tax=Roseateles asaccharophilus TaxID=582607 RepID=UPI00391BE685
MKQEAMWLLFVLLWCTAGWLAGSFFSLMRHLKKSGEWRGRLSLESTRILTMAAFFCLVLAASEIQGRADVPPFAEVAALLLCPACLVAAYRRGA